MTTLPDLEKVNILLVDDQSLGLLALEAVLSCPEYCLVKANSGSEALKCLERDEFALILLDVMMPEMDGFDTAERIKLNERNRDIPIIFITGIDEDDRYVRQGYRRGAVDYLFKPFDADILKSKVSVFVELYRKNKTVEKQARQLREIELSQLELESLRRYRSLADAIPHLVWEANADGVPIYFNKRWHDYTGLTVNTSGLDAWKVAVHPEDVDSLLNGWQNAREAKRGFEIECRIRRGKDGSGRWHVIQCVPELSPTGSLLGWLGTGADIHDRKCMEQEMRAANQAALEASRVKSEFLATMSHEIRTPMNSIIGMTGLLLDLELTAEQRDYAETIRQSGQSLLTLINDILDFSKIESGKFELEIIDFDLSRLVQDCEKSFATIVKQKGIQFDVSISKNVPNYLKGDPGRLQQVVMNLVNNAIKFTSSGTVAMGIQALPSDATRAKLRFEIQDTGIGIPEAALSRMFQSFSQADSSTTRRFGGTGLGLSICKHLVEMMGGKIGVKSAENKGSTFWFELEFEMASGRISEVEDMKLRRLPHKERGGRVLIAEDNTANQKLVLRALEKLGYRAEVVGNGKEVLDALREIPYDVILMDWHMPEMDGREATQIIRRSSTFAKPDIPIIAMTANAMTGDKEKCLEAGMNDYISKPIDFGVLAQKLEKWVRAA